ncbi:hypothetical protein K461DRAFT_278738 [Myriangium duriaei CBS 260.36]|uniref:Uncharacterized protein n=1 Tax=Myriangium duriaei CBS 260.36 TaxID=1168546 RepID=A0A9P4J2Z6_9PEZI|nr:hypothetical protein K461DRAFT_278738 [Myriangium duriaei CBS 260.36]
MSSYSSSRYYSSTTSSSTSSSSTCSSKASPPSHPIAIGFTPGGSDALMDIFNSPSSSSISSQASACAFPSWPKSGASLHSPPEHNRNRGSSYISDEDLFGLDSDDLDGSLPFLSEAPAPPRQAHEYADWLNPAAQQQQQQQPVAPVLPALTIRHKARRSPVKKSALRRTPKGMPCIRESAM